MLLWNSGLISLICSTLMIQTEVETSTIVTAKVIWPASLSQKSISMTLESSSY